MSKQDPPPLSRLWSNFPQGSADQVKARIGGKVDAEWIKNTCAIRLSDSFNKAGHPIPRGFPGMDVISGRDKKWYAYRLMEFRRWLISKYGKPTLSAKGGSIPAIFRKRRGVICFLDCNFSDAAGHLDLWDGHRCIGSEFFAVAKELFLWAEEPTSYADAPTKFVRVKVDGLNVRDRPSPSGRVVGQLARGAKVPIYLEASGWIRIDLKYAVFISGDRRYVQYL